MKRQVLARRHLAEEIAPPNLKPEISPLLRHLLVMRKKGQCQWHGKPPGRVGNAICHRIAAWRGIKRSMRKAEWPVISWCISKMSLCSVVYL